MPKGTSNVMQAQAVVRVHHHLTLDHDLHLQIEAGRRSIVVERKERSHLLKVNHHARQVMTRKDELKREMLQVQAQKFIQNLLSLVQREKMTNIVKEIVIQEDDQGPGQT